MKAHNLTVKVTQGLVIAPGKKASDALAPLRGFHLVDFTLQIDTGLSVCPTWTLRQKIDATLMALHTIWSAAPQAEQGGDGPGSA